LAILTIMELLPAAETVMPLIDQLRESIRHQLGPSLAGLYLFGSLVLGDFDPERSDIDLLAVMAEPLSADQFDGLARMQGAFIAEHPAWNDKLEIAYMSLDVLSRFKVRTGRVARISPGEPFHLTESLPHWLMDLYTVQEQGVTLDGPPPARLIPHISCGEFVACVRTALAKWQDWIAESDMEGFEAYAVLTVCRSIYAIEHGRQASKRASATYVRERYPQWGKLIDTAWGWRYERSERVNKGAQGDCRRFISFALTVQ